MKKVISIIFLLLGITVFSQDVKPYQIYNSKGKRISFEKMIDGLQKSDVVLFGEHHDNSIVHWLQLKVTKSLAEKRALTLGAEMFESDNQKVLNDYLLGKINQKQLDTLARLWNNYKTDYKPIVDFAKEKQIKVIATNVPRKFASLVYKQGVEALDALSEEEKSWMAPLPFPYDASLPGYVKMMEMFKDSNHANENFPKSQAVKDATMGYFISENLEPNKLFIHYNGSYHSDNFEGINWYLKKYNKNLKIVTITTVEKTNIDEISAEEMALADFILIIDAEMTKTF